MEQRLSVVTVVLNDVKNIQKTLNSVIDKKKDFLIKYIVIDGSSTDGTIEKIGDYYDDVDGTSIYFQQSSGLTEYNLTAVSITNDEVLLKVMGQPEIQTNVFVERGKNSAYERVQRLGEVDNLGDLINYGYGFFNVVDKKMS